MRYLYTAITGGRDVLAPPGRVPGGWSAVCFTDDPHVGVEGWEIRRAGAVEASSVRSARAHKVLAHHWLPDAEVSVWIDGNRTVACDLDALVEERLCGNDLALWAHPRRDCVYAEAARCVELGKDEPGLLEAQASRYEAAGHPEHWGLFALAAFVRRHNSTVAELERAWWAEIQAGSHRDQISLPFVLRTAGPRFVTLPWEHRQVCFRGRKHARLDAPARSI